MHEQAVDLVPDNLRWPVVEVIGHERGADSMASFQYERKPSNRELSTVAVAPAKTCNGRSVNPQNRMRSLMSSLRTSRVSFAFSPPVP